MEAEGARQVPRRAWLALAVVASATLMIAFNQTGTNIAFPALEREFPDAGRTLLSWSITGYNIALAALMLLGGRFADRFGRRRMFLAGVAVFALGSIGTALSWTVWMLIGCRIVQAVGGAIVLPSSLATVLPDFPDGRRGSVVSTWSATNSLGAAVAPSVSALIIAGVGWRGVYLVGVPVCLVALVAGRRLLRESSSAETARVDVLGVPLVALSVGALTLGIVEGPNWGWTSPGVLSSLALSAVVFPVFLFRSWRHPAPILDLTVFARRSVWSSNVANLFLAMAGMSIWLVWPLYLTNVWGYSLLQTGLAITPGPTNAAWVSIVAGRIVDRRGPRELITIGCLFPVAATVFFATRGPTDTTYLTDFLPGILLFSTGFGLTFSPLNAASLEGVPSGAFGQVNAAFNTIRTLGGAIGTAAVVAVLAGASKENPAPFDHAYLLLAACAACSALTVMLLYPKRRPSVADESVAA